MTYEYKRPGFVLTLHENRIEVAEGMFPILAKKTTILLRNIAAVEVRGLTRKLAIKTNDSKVYEYSVGTDAEKAVTAINTVL